MTSVNSYLSLNRLCSNSAGTFGVLIYDRRVLCHTLELPWLGNVQNQSCIPVGEYAVIKASSPKFGEVFYIKDVPGREGILIHPGNSLRHTRGCILPGLDVLGQGVIDSRAAMHRLYSALPSSFTLNIREV